MVVITMLLGRVRDSVSVGASSTFSAAGPSITIPLGSPRPPPTTPIPGPTATPHPRPAGAIEKLPKGEKSNFFPRHFHLMKPTPTTDILSASMALSWNGKCALGLAEYW